MDDFLFEFEDIFFEASPYRSDFLKDIDNDFAVLKKEKSIKNIKTLSNHIKDFTGIKKVTISIKSNYENAFVVPIYNQQLSLDVINLFKDYETNKNIRKLDIVEEPAKYIESIYIIFGDGIVSMFSPRELTAILLHELGHSFTHTANMPTIIIGLLRKVIITIELIPKIILIPLISLSIIQAFFITAVCFIVCRSLTFLEHRGEYKADQFAAKYGYGDEMIKVLYQFNLIQEDVLSKFSWWKKVLFFITRFFIPSSHPKSTKRMLELSDKMLDDYKKMYPKVSKELTIILSDLKSEA